MPDTPLEFISSLFGALQSANPLRIMLEAFMLALSDTLVRMASATTSALFTETALDYSNPAFASIWAITTGVSAGAILILFTIGIIHGIVTASFARMPKVVGGAILAFVLPQVVFGLLPQITTAFRLMAKAILDAAAPNLGVAIMRMAGLAPGADGATLDDLVYFSVGSFAPLLLAVFIFGLAMILIVLWVLMAVEAFVFVTAPIAAIGLAGPPSTQAWFKRWLTAAFVTAFAPVPLALTIAIATTLFGQSRPGTDGNILSALTVAVAGGVLLLGAFLAPMTGFALFKFVGDGVSQGVGFDAHTRAAKKAFHGAQTVASTTQQVRSLTNRKVKSGGGGSATPATETSTGEGSGAGTSNTGGGGGGGGKGPTPRGLGAAPGGAATTGAETGAAAAGPIGIAAVAGVAVAQESKAQVTKVADHVKDQAHQAMDLHGGSAGSQPSTDTASTGAAPSEANAPTGGGPEHHAPSGSPASAPTDSESPESSPPSLPRPPVRPKLSTPPADETDDNGNG